MSTKQELDEIGAFSDELMQVIAPRLGTMSMAAMIGTLACIQHEVIEGQKRQLQKEESEPK
jgi:hypothetical protein